MKIFLVRHGKTKGNSEGRYVGRTDEPVLPEALEPMKDLAWTKMRPEIIYTSPLIRCIQTAETLFGSDRPPEIIEDLQETDFGDFEYLTYNDLNGNPDYQAWIDSGGMKAFPHGESGVDFRKRACRGFEQCLRHAEEQHVSEIAIVTHGGVIMSVMEKYGLPKADFYSWQVKNGCGFVLREETGQDDKVMFRVVETINSIAQ